MLQNVRLSNGINSVPTDIFKHSNIPNIETVKHSKCRIREGRSVSVKIGMIKNRLPNIVSS